MPVQKRELEYCDLTSFVGFKDNPPFYHLFTFNRWAVLLPEVEACDTRYIFIYYIYIFGRTGPTGGLPLRRCEAAALMQVQLYRGTRDQQHASNVGFLDQEWSQNICCQSSVLSLLGPRKGCIVGITHVHVSDLGGFGVGQGGEFGKFLRGTFFLGFT